MGTIGVTKSRTIHTQQTRRFSGFRDITDLHNFPIKMIRNDRKSMGYNIIHYNNSYNTI